MTATGTSSGATSFLRRLVAMEPTPTPTPKPLTRRVQAERRGSGGSTQSSSSAPLMPSISSSLHSHSNASISSSPPSSPTKSPRKTRLVRVRRNSLGMEVSRTVVTEDDTSNAMVVAAAVDKKLTVSKVAPSSSSFDASTKSNSNKGGIRSGPSTVPLSPTKNSTTTVTKNAALLGCFVSEQHQSPGKPNNLQKHSKNTIRRHHGTTAPRLSTVSSPMSTAKTKLSTSAPPSSPLPPSSPSQALSSTSTSPLQHEPRGRVLHKPQLTVNQKLLGIASMEHDGTACSAAPVVIVVDVTPSPSNISTGSTPATFVPNSHSTPTTTSRVVVPSSPQMNAGKSATAKSGNTKPVNPKSTNSTVSSAETSLLVKTSSTNPRLSPPTTVMALAHTNANAATATLVRPRNTKETEPSTMASPAMMLQQQQHQMQQGERLVRIMLNESNAKLTQETVDRTLQKHADLLRNQVQHKQQHKQELLALQGEQSQIVKDQVEQIASLHAELAKQKSLMATTLEIKDVEYQLIVKERDQKAVKVQQLTWRLAKERTAGRDKSAAAAAATAATSSLTDRAEHAEHELSAQQQTIHTLQQMVEHTVSALRGKDKFLRQLMDSQQRRRRCTSGIDGANGCSQCGCDPVDLNDDLTAPTGIVEDTPIDLSSLLEAVAKGSAVQARESRCSFSMDSNPMQFQQNNRSRTSSGAEQDDDSSDATPLMGRSASSGMSLTDQECQTPSNDNVTDDSSGKKAVPRTVSKDSIFSIPSAFHELDASLLIADLQFELDAVKQQVIDAQEIIEAHHQVQVKLKSEHDEIMLSTKAKMAQIKSVLIACNERRLEAEQSLRSLGQDVNAPQSDTVLCKTPEVWNELVSSSNHVNGNSITGAASSDTKVLPEEQTQRLLALEESLRESETLTQNARSEVRTLQQALADATRRADEAATSCQSATAKLSRVQAALDLSQAQVDSYGILIQRQEKQQQDRTTTTITTMVAHHSSNSSFEEYVENVEQVSPMAAKCDVASKATAERMVRLDAEIVAKRDLLLAAESTIASLQEEKAQVSLSAPCNRSRCRDAAAIAMAELTKLRHELTVANANAADAQQKLSYLRNTVLSVATISSDEN